MKKINLLIVSIALIFSSCTDNATYKTPETEIERVSYSLGINMSTWAQSQGLDCIDINAISSEEHYVFLKKTIVYTVFFYKNT